MNPGFRNHALAVSARSVAGMVASLVLISSAYSQAAFETGAFRIEIDTRGHVTSLYDKAHAVERLAPGQPAPLVSLKAGGDLEPPSQAAFDVNTATFRLTYEHSRASVDVRVEEKDTHIAFEIVDANPVDRIDLVVWGPYPVNIGEIVGEVVGVVRNDEYAVGIQALNVKTIGGFPENDEGLTASFRGRTAQSMPWGSALQAYSMDRSRPRNVTVWNGHFPNMPVPPIPGETVVGSRIALFGCPASNALDTIGRIEIAEGLPHPLIDGVWAKQSPERGRSYLIADYSEENIDEMLGYVKRADLMGLYHGDPFLSWGHYEFHPRHFPNGAPGMKVCVEKATTLGIRLGVHTLTNFIQTNDPYITPVPDPRLARTGSSVLTQDIAPDADRIPVESPEYFANENANWLRTVVIGNELVRYRAVSESAPWTLIDCVRGAFGTQAAAHKQGAEVGKLLDHPYRVFFPNLELQGEIARNLARLFNETGLSHMDFDGHEGCLASGQGDYATDLFAKDFYDHLEHTVINGTSISTHFYWHINNYCNWGEPWYGGFRESMQEYRINNQAFFDRNFMPNMLGWYLMTETTCLSDMEWMLARAAGYGAGFALATSPAALRNNPETDTVLDAIREWERARAIGAFTQEQRERLREPRNEFHLETTGVDEWNLYPYLNSEEFVHEQVTMQPGQPTASEWQTDNPGKEQPLQFRLRVVGDAGSIANPTLEIDNFATLMVPAEIAAGQTLLYEGGTTARIYDEKGNLAKTVELSAAPPKLGPGKRQIGFDCEFQGAPAPKALVTLKYVLPPEPVKKPQ